MIIQCDACQTRFRIADDKVKPSGTKVRCSRCKSIFTIFPPPSEPIDDAVDFGAFNMEQVTAEAPAEAGQPPGPPEISGTEPTSAVTAAGKDDGFGFDTPGEEPSDKSSDGAEAADDFSFGESPAEDQDEPPADDVSKEFDFAFDETPFSAEDEPEQEPRTTGQAEPDVPEEEAPGPREFSFEDEDEGLAFDFDKAEENHPAATTDDFQEPGEFSFDDETPFEAEAATEWSEPNTGDDGAFDFDEPRFDTDSSTAAGTSAAEETELQFGEIDLPGDSGTTPTQELGIGDDAATADGGWQEEQKPFAQRPQNSSQATRGQVIDEPIPRPRPAKKSSLSRILGLLVLLLVVLGGAAGYLYLQDGSLNLRTVAQYLPFLKDYLGQPPPPSPGERVGINIIGSSYVNGQAGQMLVIQGTATNNYPTARSAITIKGILLDDQGKKLLQQTVFCGNKLEEPALRSMSFAAIEEAMNNQFGDSLSNMNVAPGAAIPFTIVFRNLPSGIANINVEVVDSKPGAG